jgi:mannose-6-phosphate isomerase-like protein (cupin superfamily)
MFEKSMALNERMQAPIYKSSPARKPLHTSISALPLEAAHGGKGLRRLVLQQGCGISPNIEAFSDTFLPKGGAFSWHSHNDNDEILVCLFGSGTIEFSSGTGFNFNERELVYIPKGLEHTISSPSGETEYFFMRIL